MFGCVPSVVRLLVGSVRSQAVSLLSWSPELPFFAMARAILPDLGTAEPEHDGEGPIPREMRHFASLAGRSGYPALLLGETGSGKTRLAGLIHQLGPRRARPFVRVNCAAIPESLFEREMFGHVRGAFTDARNAGAGFLESADGGTLFLDEISELPLQLQAKLLAVLEDGSFRRLGSPLEARVDVHVLAATNRDLAEMVRLRAFREDLYYRFCVLQYVIPPLRARLAELPELARHVLRRHSRGEVVELSDDAMRALRRHSWPGNIRELENVLLSAMVYAQGSTIDAGDLPPGVREPAADPPALPRRSACRYAAPNAPEHEVHMIREALRAHNGHRARAARSLGMSRTTLWTKLQRYAGYMSAEGESGGTGAEFPPPESVSFPSRGLV